MKLSRTAIHRRLTRFEAAHEAELFRGTRHPDDWEEISENYHREREKLISYIIKLAFAFGDKPLT